jgi:catechol 2,3-dioxygenase-like lactoylglutathione lyase family enzyme
MANQPLVSRLQDVYYNVQDMTRAVRFYSDVLGLRVVEETPYWSAFDVGGVRFGLHWTGGDPVPAIGHDSHGAHNGASVTLRVEDVDAAAEILRGKGVELVGAVAHESWGDLVTFRDPDGNVLKLMRPRP